MDFGALLHVAKKNSSTSSTTKNDNNKFYSTKFAPPKKESKEQKKLSDNIKRFLEKREIEERQKALELKEKRDKLLASRDDKSKNKIKKMLKVIKSADKSVLEDAKTTGTAVTANGSEQPDDDDYGYVSNEASALFQKYCEKVKDVKDDKGFAKSRPQSRDDLKGTKDRVRQALMKEQEEKLHPSQRTRVSNVPSSTSTSQKSESTVRKSSKELYDPKAEREAEERKRKEEEMKKKANIKKKPPPPPMNFNDLLKLAEKKQFEPVTTDIIEVKPKAKEPERLLTAKEKKELEEREARKNNKLKPQMPPPKIPLKEKEKPKEDSKKVPAVKPKTPYNGPTREFPPKVNGSSSSTSQSQKKPMPKEVPLKTREFPPKDIQKTRPFPPKDTIQKPRDTIQKTREFPPPDVRRPKPSSSSFDNRKAPKRRIIEDDDSEEYDSEMDDFIDDGDDEEDYSKHIRDIFKYDKSKYRDEYDDEPMESSFAQMQREEAFSKKMGLKEDLEDMRLEEEIKKKKELMKKKMKYR